jgi:hypothetical protein
MTINFNTLENNTFEHKYKKNNKLKSIIIIEPKLSHWTTVEPIVALFANRGWKVTVFAPKKLNEIIENNAFIKKNKFLLSFIDYSPKNLLLFSLIKKYDIMVVANRFFHFRIIKITIYSFVKNIITLFLSFFFFYIHSKKSFFIITSHQVEVLDLPLIKIKKRVWGAEKGGEIKGDRRWCWHLIRFLEHKIWSFAKSKIKVVNVYSSLVKIEAEKVTEQSLPILLAPNAINFEKMQFAKMPINNLLKIVIPGRIDTQMRYYGWIEKIPSYIKKKVEIVLLGLVTNENDFKIIQKFEKLGFPQPIARTGKFIDGKLFKKEIESANFLFFPAIRLSNSYRQIDRNLGSLFDSVRYGKPLISPSHQPIPQEIRENIIAYKNDDDLMEILKLLIDDQKKALFYAKKAYNNSKKFSIDQLTYYDEVLAAINKKN